MSQDPIHAGWHDLDEEPVPVRSGAAAPAVNAVPVHYVTQAAVAVHPHALSMKLSAITGVGIVLAAVGFYFGIDNLRGSLTSGNTTSVTITADGHFSPPSVSIVGGSTLTIDNQNDDPQVLKVKNGTELFPVQVIFKGTPYSFTVPTNVSGTFTYTSETLPSTEELTIVVSESIEAGAADSSDGIPIPFGSQQANDVPIPFGSSASSEIPIPFGSSASREIPIPFSRSSSSTSSSSSSSTSSSSSSTSSSSSSSSSGGGSSGGGGGGGSSGGGGGGGGSYRVGNAGGGVAYQPNYTNYDIPTNPYTVEAGQTKGDRSKGLAEAQKNAQDLHKGAEITTKHPKTVTETGPEMWLVISAALGLMVAAYRRMQRI